MFLLLPLYHLMIAKKVLLFLVEQSGLENIYAYKKQDFEIIGFLGNSLDLDSGLFLSS